MQSGYIINVAVRTTRAPNPDPKYTHLFRTDVIPDRSDARQVLIELNAAFPAPHYNVSCTHWDVRGRQVTLDQLEV